MAPNPKVKFCGRFCRISEICEGVASLSNSLPEERPILLKREFDPAKKAASDKLRSLLSKESPDEAEDVIPDEVVAIFYQTKEDIGDESKS
jgi:hypothetical protein